jgi:hypothetical protein
VKLQELDRTIGQYRKLLERYEKLVGIASGATALGGRSRAELLESEKEALAIERDMEVYVNVVGGWRIEEPGCDLAVALAVASSALDVPMGRLAAWGEVGLAGEVRSIPMEARRVEELDRMGLVRRVAPGAGEPMRLVDALARAGLG